MITPTMALEKKRDSVIDLKTFVLENAYDGSASTNIAERPAGKERYGT